MPLDLKNTTVDIFADDTNISTTNKSVDQIANLLSADLNSVENWCKSNSMSLNITKSKVMYVASKHTYDLIKHSLPTIPFNDSFINVSSSEKLLGITITSTLAWDNHINLVLKKCNSLLFLLSRIKIYLSIDMRKRFYNAYILPHFDYCCVIWGNCSNALEDKLVKFQKRAARLILNKDLLASSSIMFDQLKWMTFPERVIYLKSVQMYKTLNGKSPEYLKVLFTFTSDIHSRLLRSITNEQLYIPRPNKDLYRNSFAFSGSSIWNSLPLTLKQSSSIAQFKRLYLKWFKET